MIHALLDTTKVLHSLEIEGVVHELCAEAIANHDRHSNQITVNLRAFLRSTEHTHIGETATPSWLPASQVVTEHVDAEEAHAMANDIFASWCHSVSAAHP